MALGVRKSTWRQLSHDIGLSLRDVNDGINHGLRFENVNGGMQESLREDIPVDETDQERWEREEEERREREEEEQEIQDEIDREREEQEREWQEEQDRILAEEARQPGAFQQMWDKFKESDAYQSFHDGYVGARNALVGGALVGAGLGVTAGTPALAITAAPAVYSVGKDVAGWIKSKQEAQAQREAEAQAAEAAKELRKAEAQASVGVSEDQRQKAEVGSTAYNNIKAKERTVDQVIAESEAAVVEATSKKVDPDFVQKSADELMARLEKADQPMHTQQFGM